MRIEAICTGDELLTGLTADTNSPHFMSRVLELGEQVAKVQVVGDVESEIESALHEAAARADVVLVSGGLGPTADDLTVACAARAAKVRLVEDPRVLAHLRARLAQRGLPLTPNNAKQALVPEGAEVVQNPVGSAPMLALSLGRCRFFFVAGVPREYRRLVDDEVLPRLRRLVEAQPGRVFRAFALLRTVGLPESQLDARVKPLAARHPDVAFGFRTHAPENQLKLLAHGQSQAAAEAALAAARAECVAELGDHLFGEGAESLEEGVARLLLERGATVAVAESCTGGGVSEVLSRVAGASGFLRGGVVVYQDELKVSWAGVDEALLARAGAVSAEVARQLAAGIRARLGATHGLSVTGFAGPGGGTPDAPVGTVFVAVAGPGATAEDLEVVVERHLFPGERERVRAHAAYAVVDLLRRVLLRGAVR